MRDSEWARPCHEGEPLINIIFIEGDLGDLPRHERYYGSKELRDPRTSSRPSTSVMFSKSGSDLSAVNQIQRIWRGRTEPEPNFENIVHVYHVNTRGKDRSGIAARGSTSTLARFHRYWNVVSTRLLTPTTLCYLYQWLLLYLSHTRAKFTPSKSI